MRRTYYEAAIPEPTIVLGLPLLPLSLGHLLLLRRINSPFLHGGTTDITDLATAVIICAQTYERALASFDDPDRDKFMRIWHDRITGNNHWSVRLGLRAAKTIDFQAACAELASYLEENMTGPNYKFELAGNRSVDCPAEQIIKVSLMRDLHLTDAQLLDRSWLMCLWDYATLQALSGGVEFVDDEAVNDARATAEALMQAVKEGRLNGFHS